MIISDDSEHGNPQQGGLATSTSTATTSNDFVNKEKSEKLNQVVTALALHEKEHALKVGIVVHDPSLSDSKVRAIPSILSQCRLVAMTLLNTTTSSSKNTTSSSKNTQNSTKDSCCQSDPSTTDPTSDAAAKQWLDQHASGYPMMHHVALDHNIHSTSSSHFARPSAYTDDEALAFYNGLDGYADMLANPQVEAIYLLVPTAHQQSQLVLQALAARKHVLIHDPQSTTLEDFQQQVQLARSVQRFIQFSTMFQSLNAVHSFLDSVAPLFLGGKQNDNDYATSMHALLTLHPSDFAHCGVHQSVLTEQDSCIRRLARYCVLCALILLQQKGHSHPTAVQMTDATVQSQSELYGKQDGVLLPLIITQASGTVWFTNDRVLTFTVGYSMTGRTRQVLEVHSPDKYATMNDFVIPHADGLANYRVYDKITNELHPSTTHHRHHRHHHHPSTNNTTTTNNKTTNNPITVDPDHEDRGIHVTGGDAIDVLSGPPSSVMTWRHFSQICRQVEERGDDDDHDSDDRARTLTDISIQLKGILNKLEESYKAGCVKLELDA